ncbi:hypothetical protein [Sphingomonas arenae]|uniref:hypothetical protein n=1 Tax=Sphingomonas arenae TaxID=2812555 RepID=UPI001967D287|nr:hypothetical protein [Sphingomonas arenae]
MRRAAALSDDASSGLQSMQSELLASILSSAFQEVRKRCLQIDRVKLRIVSLQP